MDSELTYTKKAYISKEFIDETDGDKLISIMFLSNSRA
jgi:hypothetical protein